MNNFLKDNWFKILIILILTAFTYFVALRPYLVRRSCRKLIEKAQQLQAQNPKIQPDYQSIYNDCLYQGGLENQNPLFKE